VWTVGADDAARAFHSLTSWRCTRSPSRSATSARDSWPNFEAARWRMGPDQDTRSVPQGPLARIAPAKWSSSRRLKTAGDAWPAV